MHYYHHSNRRAPDSESSTNTVLSSRVFHRVERGSRTIFREAFRLGHPNKSFVLKDRRIYFRTFQGRINMSGMLQGWSIFSDEVLHLFNERFDTKF